MIPQMLMFMVVSSFSEASGQSPHLFSLHLQNNLALVFTSKKVKERLLTASLGSWWQLIFLIIVATIPDSTGKWAKWILLSLLLAYPYAHPLLVSNVSGVSPVVKHS